MTAGAAAWGLVGPFEYAKAYGTWVQVAAPGAGLNASITFGGTFSTRVLAARATLTTDANAANRELTLDYLDQRANIRLRNGGGAVFPANTTGKQFDWSSNRGVGESVANGSVFLPLAPFFLDPGMAARFTVANIQAGDTLTVLSLWIEQFLTGPEGYELGPREYVAE